MRINPKLMSVFLLIPFMVFAQEKPVKVNVQQGDRTFIFSVKNNSDMPQEVTLKLTKSEGLKVLGKQPIIKIVPPGGEITFFRAKRLETKTNYSTSYNWKIPEKFLESQNKKNKVKLKSMMLEDGAAINEGIVVFNKEDCPRCMYSTNYLLENDIPFKMLNTVESPENSKLMWNFLRALDTT